MSRQHPKIIVLHLIELLIQSSYGIKGMYPEESTNYQILATILTAFLMFCFCSDMAKSSLHHSQ